MTVLLEKIQQILKWQHIQDGVEIDLNFAGSQKKIFFKINFDFTSILNSAAILYLSARQLFLYFRSLKCLYKYEENLIFVFGKKKFTSLGKF
jgi:hypothetical protein